MRVGPRQTSPAGPATRSGSAGFAIASQVSAATVKFPAHSEGVWSDDERCVEHRCLSAGPLAFRRHAGLSGRGHHGHLRTARGVRLGQCHRPPAALSAGHRRNEHRAGRHLARHPHHTQRRGDRHQGTDRHAARVRRLRPGRARSNEPLLAWLRAGRKRARRCGSICNRRLHTRRGWPARRQARDHALGDGRRTGPALSASLGRGRPDLRARRQRLHLGRRRRPASIWRSA